MEDDLRTRIRAAGLRVTAARVEVLRLLSERTTPSSHPEVFASLQERGWDRATLYRNLVDLSEAGILRRVDHGDHVWRYELAQTTHGDDVEHPHFLCTSCGDLSCLDAVVVQLPQNSAIPGAMRTGRVQIQFRGLCDRCG
jgi:Fur family transcriptional regulator, ferric uptake regulator